MFAGHIGIGLAIARSERRVNVGVFVAAALLLDVVLWISVLLGWESVAIPVNFALTHQPEFVFPYSHGLAGSFVWSALAGATGLFMYAESDASKWRVAFLICVAVFSHWLLDALVHQAEMPLVGANSHKFGLGLWQHMLIALVAEAVIVLAGLLLFVPSSGLSRGKSLTLTLFVLVTLGFTVVGMTIAPPPPSTSAMASSSLVTISAACLFVGWLGKPYRGRLA